MKETVIYLYIKVLAVLGITLASYLLYNFYARPATQFCTINDRINCYAVTTGPISTFLGFPVALIGLVGYVVILISALAKNKTVGLFMAAFGTLFCLRLTFLEIFQIKVICPVCLVCQLDMLVTLGLFTYLTLRSEPKEPALPVEQK